MPSWLPIDWAKDQREQCRSYAHGNLKPHLLRFDRPHTGVDNTPVAMFGFESWSPERRRNDPVGLRLAILGQLSDCFGKTAAHPLELVVQDWAMNPRIVTDLDASQPAAHPEVGPPNLRTRILVAASGSLFPRYPTSALVSSKAHSRSARGWL